MLLNDLERAHCIAVIIMFARRLCIVRFSVAKRIHLNHNQIKIININMNIRIGNLTS